MVPVTNHPDCHIACFSAMRRYQLCWEEKNLSLIFERFLVMKKKIVVVVLACAERFEPV